MSWAEGCGLVGVAAALGGLGLGEVFFVAPVITDVPVAGEPDAGVLAGTVLATDILLADVPVVVSPGTDGETAGEFFCSKFFFSTAG